VLEIVRKRDRLRFPDSPDSAKPAYYFESLDFPVSQRVLNSYLAEFESLDDQASRFHEHPGIELLYVISGKLDLQFRGEKHELAEGDAIYFDSTVPHAYRRIGAKRTTAFVATVGL
jgi:quercetin dioxygenase-like cupin family protein